MIDAVESARLAARDAVWDGKPLAAEHVAALLEYVDRADADAEDDAYNAGYEDGNDVGYQEGYDAAMNEVEEERTANDE